MTVPRRSAPVSHSATTSDPSSTSEPVPTTSAFLYLPVLHAGYVAFLTDPDPALDHVYLVGRSFEEEFPVLRKEIRALAARDGSAPRPHTLAGHARQRGARPTTSTRCSPLPGS